MWQLAAVPTLSLFHKRPLLEVIMDGFVLFQSWPGAVIADTGHMSLIGIRSNTKLL